MSDYEAGAVATATARGVPDVRVFRLDTGYWISSEVVGPTRVHLSEVTDVRPLVVIDPENREQVERFVRALPLDWNLEQRDDPDLFHESVDQVRAALRSLIHPPKPEEPTGLGAVVEDAEGRRWVRTLDADEPWVDSVIAGDWIEYDRIDAVRVLSEGVQP